MRVTVAASMREMQSHRTLPCGVQTSSARWPMAKLRLSADADQTRLVLAERVEMADRELVERRPGLSTRRRELALVLAHATLSRRSRARRILRAARRADEGRHCLFPIAEVVIADAGDHSKRMVSSACGDGLKPGT